MIKSPLKDSRFKPHTPFDVLLFALLSFDTQCFPRHHSSLQVGYAPSRLLSLPPVRCQRLASPLDLPEDNPLCVLSRIGVLGRRTSARRSKPNTVVLRPRRGARARTCRAYPPLLAHTDSRPVGWPIRMLTPGRGLGLVCSLLLTFSDQLLWLHFYRNSPHLVLCHS